jgi:hypothetical protein
MRYTPHRHKHNFSAWAAARASQRGFAKVTVLQAALEQSGVEDFAKRPRKLGNFDELHSGWCCSICASLKSADIGNVTYGRAAKLVNVYLKSMIVLPDMNSKAAEIVHPPIDRILLKNIVVEQAIPQRLRDKCKKINWTQLDVEAYFELITVLREIIGDRPFWTIEKYWEPG